VDDPAGEAGMVAALAEMAGSPATASSRRADGVILTTLRSSTTTKLARCGGGSTLGSRWRTVEPATHVAELTSAKR
jgi:hypothetical protein